MKPTPSIAGALINSLEHAHILSDLVRKALPVGSPSWIADTVHWVSITAFVVLALISLWHVLGWIAAILFETAVVVERMRSASRNLAQSALKGLRSVALSVLSRVAAAANTGIHRITKDADAQ